VVGYSGGTRPERSEDRRHGAGLFSPPLLAAIVIALAPRLAVAQQAQQPTEWAKMPRMQLERQFAGPLQDTIVQRWRDPADGSICYIYLPITAQHSPAVANGYVQYGPNAIGSISCFAAPSTGKGAASPGRASAPPPVQ
jgi:hypothetical protein